MSRGDFQDLVNRARSEADNPSFKAYFPLYDNLPSIRCWCSSSAGTFVSAGSQVAEIISIGGCRLACRVGSEMLARYPILLAIDDETEDVKSYGAC